jgi:DNA-binding transcriptional ArsR family regulator
MVQYTRTHFDASFAALSDATRRGVLERLGRADASITDLAEKFHMTLTGMKKHVGVLEQAGLVITEKVGRVRTCKLGLSRLEEEAAWIERYRQLWDVRFDELDKVVEELKRKEKSVNTCSNSQGDDRVQASRERLQRVGRRLRRRTRPGP